MTPVDPPKKTIGRNTADSTRAMATSAIWIWPIEMIVASLVDSSGLLVQDPLDVFDDDDRVIDQQADGEHQPEQGQRVDRKAEDIEHPEGAEQHDRDGDSGISVARQLCRKTNMTRMTSAIASARVFTTSITDSLMKSELSLA